MGQEWVKLRTRRSRDGQRYSYLLDFVDEQGKRRRESLGHCDRQKAERHRAQKERELRTGDLPAEQTRLSDLLGDNRSSRQEEPVCESTLVGHDAAMKEFINTVGDLCLEDVRRKHARIFREACLTKGNSPMSAKKKISNIKHFLELGVQDEILEANPFRKVRFRKPALKTPHVFDLEECNRLIEATAAFAGALDWELLILLALSTGMRRGELLNLTWADLDFKTLIVNVSAKGNTRHTWEWRIKDAEERRLPITKEVADLLLARCGERMKLHPYVFVPAERYQHIQERREQGKWTLRDGKCPMNNFDREFRVLLKRAEIEKGEFHDLRRTALSRWFANGLSEYDVMNLAGHADFETTHRFYLAVRTDLIDRARAATTAGMGTSFGARLARAGISG